MTRLGDAALDLLGEWTPIRSVAGNAAGLRRMADTLAARLQCMGGKIMPQGLAAAVPVVHARFDRGAPVTIMLYNMYDVMPATDAGWSAAPFTGGLVDLPQGSSYVARGADNNKGPLAGMLVALEALLPVLCANLEVVIEGEEETGSHTLRQYLADGQVRRCTAALFPSFCEYGGGPPRVYLGSKGIAHGRIRIAGGAWGGPTRAIHSSNIPWFDSPAWALVHALAGLADGPNGLLGRAGLPSDAAPVLAALAEAFDRQAELRFRAMNRFALDGSVAEQLEAVLTSESLNLSEIRTEPLEGRATIPPAAEARFDLRVPPGLDVQGALDSLRARLPAGAELLLEDAYPGYRFPLGAPGVAALLEVYQDAGLQPQVWPWAIGAMPAYAFSKVADSVLIGGLGHGGNAHGVDEFVTLDGLDRFIQSLLAWLPATVAHCSGSGGCP